MTRIGKTLLVLFATAASMAAVAKAAADYAMQWPLALGRDDGGAYRVVLDETVYRRLRDPQLRDLVVLNHAGVAVPTAVFAPDQPLAQPPRRIAVPWFALPTAAAAGGAQGWELVSQADADGRLRHVEARITDQSAATLPRSALLVDVSHVREAIVALELHWQPVAALDLGYRVEASDDLEHWQPQVVSGRMIDLQRDGRRLLQRRIELPDRLPDDRQARYLRLTPERSDQPVAIDGVSVELAAARAAPAPSWLELAGRRSGSGAATAFEFELDGRFPVQQVDVALAGNHALEWRLESRDDADAPWQLRAGPWMAYRVDTAGSGSSSPARELDASVRDRHWRLRANTPVSGMPALRLGYRPETVVFLAQGPAPYVLAAGSARARRAATPIAELVAELRRQRGADWQPSPAYLGVAKPLAGEAALQPVRDWRSWLLWAVLASGAVVVTGFAFSLLRSPKSPT